MYLRIRGSEFSGRIFKEIEAITNGAILHFRDVRYDKEKALVVLPIDRFGRTREKTSCFGIFRHYKTFYGGDRIPATIAIRNVIHYEIVDHMPTGYDEFEIPFGLGIKGNRIFAASMEEDTKYEALYDVEIGVNEIDIEIKDKSADKIDSSQ